MIYTAFNGYTASFSKWFLPRFDNRASLQTSCGFWRAISGGVVSESRLLALKKLGAICALMLIHGICPEPLNPLIFQFIIHNGDFNSLHRSLIQEWHSELFDLINRWLAVGPDDSLEPFRAHFASYHDIDVSCFIRFSNFILISNSRFLLLTEISQTKHQKFYTMRSLVLSLLFILSGKLLSRGSR